MEKIAQRQNIVLQWLSFRFLEMPKNILKGWSNFLRFYWNYFSIPDLIKTLFSPWRRYQWSYGRGFDIRRYLEVAISNLILRLLGAILRFFLILIGLLMEIFLIFGGAIVFFVWVLLPVFLIAGLYLGFRILF